ncbi:MAG TPA: hypothetical protein VGM33_03330 [Baekduia sp.]|jgi:hypothetical protein
MAQSLLEQIMGGSLGSGSPAQQSYGTPAMTSATPPAGSPAWSPDAPPQDPLAALFQGSVKWQQHHPHEDVLAGLARASGNGGTAAPSLVTNDDQTGLNHVASITSHGPREGQGRQTFDLGNGFKVNTYFDAKGKRKTFVYRAGTPSPPAAAPAA